MLRNYIKIALRNIINKPFFSIINIVGLALGMAACITIFYYIGYEFSYEKSFNDSEDIYRLHMKRIQPGQTTLYTGLPSALKHTLEDIPGIRNSFRLIGIDYQNNSLINENGSSKEVFEQQDIYFADPEIINTLGLELIENAPSKFQQPYSMIITKGVANKLFGEKEALGKTITISGNIGQYQYEVAGVIDDLPQNTEFDFKVLLSISTIEKIEGSGSENSWVGWNSQTFVKTQDEITKLENDIQEIIKDKPFSKEKDSQWFVGALPIQDLHLASINEDGTISYSGENLLFGLVAIGIFILVLAWTNFINLSTSRAAERSREVGVRKVLGSHKYQLWLQFMLESVFINLVAFFLAFTIVQLVKPLLIAFTNPLELISKYQIIFWIAIVSLFLFGSVISSLYPGFILSRFKPVNVLKGNMTSGGTGSATRKGLVIFQFVVSSVMITGTYIVYQQLNFMKNKELGMKIDNMLIIEAPPGSLVGDNNEVFAAVSAFKTEASKLPFIENITSSSYVPAENIGWNGFMRRQSQEDADMKSMRLIACDKNYAQTYGMKLIAGRFFNESDDTFRTGEFVINEESVHYLGFNTAEDAIGAKLEGNGSFSELIIIGVVDNFHQQSLREQIQPCGFVKSIWNNYFTAALHSGDKLSGEEKIEQLEQNIAGIRQVWDKHFPDAPFDYSFLDDNFNALYKTDQQFGLIVFLFAIISIIIAVLGLTGLITYTIARRTKEIGIRKVMGASVRNILTLVTKDYVKLIITAIIIAIPLAYWIMEKWLADYSYRIDLQVKLFLIPVIIMLTIAVGLIGSQISLLAKKNPVDSLRQE